MKTLVTMNKLKRMSIIFIIITAIMGALSVITKSGLFIFGTLASLAVAITYTYLHTARKKIRKDVLEEFK